MAYCVQSICSQSQNDVPCSIQGGGHKTVGGLPFCSCLKIQASASIKVRKVWVMGEYKVSESFVTFVCTTFELLLLKLDQQIGDIGTYWPSDSKGKTFRILIMYLEAISHINIYTQVTEWWVYSPKRRDVSFCLFHSYKMYWLSNTIKCYCKHSW